MFDYNSKADKQGNIFTFFLSWYLPFWPVFIALIVIGLIGAWSYMHFKSPIYEATATLIIKDEKKGVDNSQILESMNFFNSKKIVENEIEVVQSRDLRKQVVNHLALYAPIYENEGIRSKSAYTTSPIRVRLKDPHTLTSLGTEKDKYSFSYNPKEKRVHLKGHSYPLNKWVKTPFGEVKFFENPAVKNITGNPLSITLLNPKLVTENLLKSLNVTSANKLSTVVDITYHDAIPQRAEDVLNELITAYNQSAVEETNTLAANTLSFIEDRMASVSQDLDSIEKRIQFFKSEKNVVNLSEQGKIYLENVGNNDRKVADINLQLAVLNKVENYVVSKDNRAGIVPSTLGVNDEVLQELLQKLYNAELKYERLSKTVAANNPMLTSVENEIAKIRPSILENVHSQQNNLQASLENLNSTSQKYNSTLQAIPEKERQLLEISRKKATITQLYSFLLQKREETALSFAPSAVESRIVDRAEASVLPVSPRPLVIYLIAVVFAVGLGIVYVTAKEMLNKKILFRSEIEESFSIPIVAELSQLKSANHHTFKVPEESLLVEQFRKLKTNLGLYSRYTGKRKILITSSISGEGKSFVSSNLAFSLAQSGKKVALVDMDFRKPRTSELFNLKEQTGAIEFFNGEAEISSIFYPSGLNENLYLLPAGKSSGYHPELLSENLDLLFEYLERTFDFVVIDTAPLEMVSDAFLLSEYCDTVLMVLRHSHTPKKILDKIKHNRKINTLQQEKIGIIFNGVKNRGFVDSTYGMDYGYEIPFSNKR